MGFIKIYYSLQQRKNSEDRRGLTELPPCVSGPLFYGTQRARPPSVPVQTSLNLS